MPRDTNGHIDVFVRDRRRGRTSRVDVQTDSPGPNQSNADSQALAVSAGGRYRVFASSASNLVRSDTNHAADIFIHDRRTHRTYRVDFTQANRQANRGVGKLQEHGFAMTPGARWIAFVSASTNMTVPTPHAVRAHVPARAALLRTQPLAPDTQARMAGQWSSSARSMRLQSAR